MTQLTQMAGHKSLLLSGAKVAASVVLFLVITQISVRAQWTTNGNNINNTNSGNVGIGTTTPASTLHVATESSTTPRGITNSQHSADGNGGLLIFRKSRGSIASPAAAANGDSIGNLYSEAYDGTSYTSGGRIRFVIDGAVSAGVVPTSVQFFSGTGSSGGVERMRINSAGHIGMGTTNPVFDSNASSRYLSLDGGSGGFGSIGAAGGTNSNGTTVGQVAFVNSNLGTTEKRVATIVGATDTATNSGTLDFYTASAGAWGLPRMRISSGGNVGIGTMSPGFRFDVQGGQLNASGGLCIAGDCKTAWSQVGGGGSSQWTTSGANIYYNTGNVGIGTTAPGSKLFVGSGTPAGSTLPGLNVALGGNSYVSTSDGIVNTFIGADTSLYGIVGTLSNHPLGLRANNTLAVTVLPGGNVGIGTASPTAQLHIAGANGLANNTAAPAPDALKVAGGTGGNGSWGASPGGVGGGMSFAGGTGGTPVAGSQSALGGKGGSINLVGGGGGPNVFAIGGGAGGDVSINGGAGVDNSDGNIFLANLRGKVGIGTAAPGYRLDVQGGQINSSGGLCIAGVCKAAWSEVGSQWTTGGSSVYYNGGNVGIGAAAPAVKLAIGGNGVNVYSTDAWTENNFHVQGNEALTQGGRGRLRVGTAWGFVGLYADSSSTGISNDLVLGAGGGVVRVGPGAANAQNFIVPNGIVGINTATPNSSYKLDVNGSTNVNGNVNVTGSGNITASGNLTVSGTINAKYQDVAEWVESSQQLTAATVVVLDQTKSNQVVASSQAYDTRVAGVISLQPGITLGEKSETKVLVATTGRVKVKVDATSAPIHVGDLLVTSDIAGVAKKSEPLMLGGVQIHRPGTLIGKALEPLEKGTGEILVLLSLQ